MTIIPTRLEQIERLTLDSGAHNDPNTDDMSHVHACVMEAVAFVAGEPWSDHPECASKVIGAFLRSWNDSLPDVDRQALKRYIPLLVGSKGTPEQESARAWMATDWLVRTHTPAWLRLAGLTTEADALTALPELTSADAVPSIKGPLEAARKNAAAAGDAARDAAWDAARAAAGAAARAAAWYAAGDAARDAARAAARDAARAAARAAAWYAAGAAAWDAAWDAAGDAAGDAAVEALAPTVAELQESAHDLVDRMLAVTET